MATYIKLMYRGVVRFRLPAFNHDANVAQSYRYQFRNSIEIKPALPQHLQLITATNYGYNIIKISELQLIDFR